jgi:subtilisin family serine protease
MAYQQFERKGTHVVVGIVDTGIDLTHPDFQTPDGHTRVAWLLDLSQSKPLGLHQDLEDVYGCTSKNPNGDYVAPCAVFSSDDINLALDSGNTAGLPQDAVGHGTHVASLAAGNGSSNVPPQYVGIAPEADLVVVNAARSNQGGLQDPDIILGAKFVFDVATLMNQPAVVNLSLGGDAGAHDGTSILEVELSNLVGSGFPGRAIVVAAGNSAELYSTATQYPSPLGIHTSVQVLPDGNKTRVPIVVDASAIPGIDSDFIAWVQSREGDSLSVGVDTDSGECISPIGSGEVVNEKDCGGTTVTLYNGLLGGTDSPNGGSSARPAIALIATGKFETPKVFALTITGSGTAFVWVQSDGGLNPSLPTMGALVPAATRERTIAIPASATALIAVGATVNRNSWSDITGNIHRKTQIGALSFPLPGDVASFSAGGPNQLDAMKPDILAPGAYVIGAMASTADPRKAMPGGMFDSTGDNCLDSVQGGAPQCPDGTDGCLCYVIDERHGVAIGTSMASPLVAGAVALLLEASPTLTQNDIRHYLQAGAQKPVGQLLALAQEGPGILDVNGALQALSSEPIPSDAAYAYSSWMTVSTKLVHPDDDWPTFGTLHLRDSQNRPVTLDTSRINVNFSPGHLLSPVKSEGYGYYTFSFAAGNGTGRQTMSVAVLVDGAPLLSETLSIGVDVASARGDVVAGRGCGIATHSTKSLESIWGLCLALAALRFSRRSQRAYD